MTAIAESFSALNDRDHRRARRRMKKLLKKQARKASGPTKDQLEDVLEDGDLLDDVLGESWAQFAVVAVVAEIGDGRMMDQLIRFFDWVIENWDAIQKIIETIIGMFG